jgi:hypothetical protein
METIDEDENTDKNALKDDSCNLDEVNLDLIFEEFRKQENFVQGVNLGENVIGSLNSNMQEMHIISDPSVILYEDGQEKIVMNLQYMVLELVKHLMC